MIVNRRRGRKKIRNHIEHWNQIVDVIPGEYSASEEDAWDIRENEEMIAAYTFMDNFSMRSFLRHIGVKSEDIDWDGHLL